MKGLLLLGFLFCLVLCCEGGTPENRWTSAVIPGSSLPNPDDNDGLVFWGLSFYLNVTLYDDFVFPDHRSNDENGNNTDYVVTLSTLPQVYTLSPSSLTFRLSIVEGATPPYSDNDMVFSPAFQLVTVTALDMSAITRDPIWRFNKTNTYPVQPTDLDIELNVIIECLDDGDPCDNIDDYNNTVDFYSPELRKILHFCTCFVH